MLRYTGCPRKKPFKDIQERLNICLSEKDSNMNDHQICFEKDNRYIKAKNSP